MEITETANCDVVEDDAINTEKNTTSLPYVDNSTSSTSFYSFDVIESKSFLKSANESTSPNSQSNNSEQYDLTSMSNSYESINEGDNENIATIDKSSTYSSEDVTATASDHPYRISTVETLEIVEPVYL